MKLVGTNLRPPHQATHPFFLVLSGENRLGSSDCHCADSPSLHTFLLQPSYSRSDTWHYYLLTVESILGSKENVFSKWTWQQFSKGSKLRTLKKLMAFFSEDLRMSVPLILAFILGEGEKNVKGLIPFNGPTGIAGLSQSS